MSVGRTGTRGTDRPGVRAFGAILVLAFVAAPIGRVVLEWSSTRNFTPSGPSDCRIYHGR